MVRLLPTLVYILLSAQLLAQPLRYSQAIFQQSDTLKNVEYASSEWLNNPFSLLADYNIHDGEDKTELRPVHMDIFLPKDDTVTKRPAILFLHSGGFLIGSNQNDDMIALCDSFARRGYVTTTLGYRIGMGSEIATILGFPVSIKLSEKNAIRAIYRAIQDSRAAIRYLKHNAENLGIDTTKIYMVGSSAGGFVALHNLYMNRPSEIPEYALSSPTLGSLDTVGIQGYGSQANAIVSMWGALEKPELIENEKSPVLLIHGTDDDIVYFKKGMPLASLIPENEAIDFSVPETWGGFCIDTMLNNRGVEHETYFVPNKKHEFYGVATGMFGEDGPNQYWDTIQWKISDFLLNIFQPDANFEINTNELTVSFSNTSTSDYYTHWDFGDGNTSSKVNPDYIYNNYGLYRIRLTTCNQNMACDTISKSLLLKPVSTTQNSIRRISVYPNPVKNRIFIQGVEAPFTATIIDLTGSIQMIESNITTSNIAVNYLSNGIYLLKVESEGKVIFRKFIKQE